jgi:DNA-binding CsgD family transcriptional regulator
MPPRMFSPREYDVLDAIANGNTTYRSIAKRLGVGEKAVQAHLLHIYEQTGCENMAGLVLWLVDNGYISRSRGSGRSE